MATRSPTYTLSPLLKRAIIWLKNWASDILKRNLLFIAALLMSTFLMKRVFSICVCSITEATSNLSLAEKWAGLQNISEGVLATWYICSRRMRKKDELTAHSCRTYQLCDPKCFPPSCHPLNQLTFFEILLPFSKGDTMVGSRC